MEHSPPGWKRVAILPDCADDAGLTQPVEQIDELEKGQLVLKVSGEVLPERSAILNAGQVRSKPGEDEAFGGTDRDALDIDEERHHGCQNDDRRAVDT